MKFFQKSFLIAVSLYFGITTNLLPQAGAALTFSEIMFNPAENNGEFIEIYNTSSTETIDVAGYKIKYYTSSPNVLTAFIGGTRIAPGKFALILQGNYDYNNGIYKSIIPPGALILKTGTNNFGSAGMANTTNRDLSLLNASDEIIDTYTYTADNEEGFSDEKTTLTKNNTLINWANSIVLNGTPGFKKPEIILPGYSFGSLIINEIMFDPGEGNSEYLEFYNTLNDSIQLSGFQVKAGTTGKYKLTGGYLILPPKKYFVLSADSSIYRNYSWLKGESVSSVAGSSTLSLSNEGTLIVLKDSKGNTLDSLSYSPGWHSKNIVTTKNRSLERLNPLFDSNNPANWNSSAAAEWATPGRQNSIFSQNLLREAKVTINPNPFSPDGDGFEDFAVINFSLTTPLSQVRIKVYDSQGRLVRTLSENRPSSSNNSVVFNGLDDSGNPLRIGIYILLIEAAAENSGNVRVYKSPVVIARKL